MSTTTYTRAQNAQFLAELASSLARGEQPSQDKIARLDDLAASEAEHDPAYVAFVNSKVGKALSNSHSLYTEAEVDDAIASW